VVAGQSDHNKPVPSLQGVVGVQQAGLRDAGREADIQVVGIPDRYAEFLALSADALPQGDRVLRQLEELARVARHGRAGPQVLRTLEVANVPQRLGAFHRLFHGCNVSRGTAAPPGLRAKAEATRMRFSPIDFDLKLQPMPPTLATRKPVDELTAAELETFPVWEFAVDEDGDGEEQDHLG